MADIAELLLAKTAEEYELVLNLKDPLHKLREKPTEKSTGTLLQSIKTFHDSIHRFDDGYRSEFISELMTEGFEDEQVWQQQELQLDSAKRFLMETFSVTNIEEAHLSFENQHTQPATKGRTNGILSKPKGAVKERDDVDSASDDGGSDGDADLLMDSEESDTELENIKKRIQRRDKDSFDGFGDEDLDDEDDTLFKGEEEDEDGDEDENNIDFDFDLPSKEEKNVKAKQPPAIQKSRRKTEVDDKFFKLADMEEFLIQEDEREEKKLKKSKEDNDEEESESEDETKDMDMFSAWPEEETSQEAMYSDFFDPPPDDADATQQTTAKQPDQSEEEEEGDDDDDQEEDDEEDDDEEDMEFDDEKEESGKKKKVRFSANEKDSDDEDDEVQQLSTFEKRNERLHRQIHSLEEDSMATKGWQMGGEVGASDRPENSLLEEHVQFKQTAPAASEITEEMTQNIEELILQRIKDKAFDDNQRQVRPREEAFQLKTHKTVDQEKSKLSLHEVYEQEYLKLQAPEDEEEETNPLHEEVKKMMAFLFPRLDALASWHFTPTQSVPEIKIKNNLPAIQMEEATPITMSSATVLAPEEIQAKRKGEVKGKTERTKEDKQRERKQKKTAKRQKMKEKEKRHKEVEKQNPGLGNKYSKERALKELEKQAKGNIEVIKDKKSKKPMSSKAFFTQLQEEVSSQIQSKTKTKKEKKKQKSSDKLLL